MTLFELVATLLCLAGSIAGAIVGAHYAWWWCPIGALLGFGAGYAVWFLIALALATVMSVSDRRQGRRTSRNGE